MACADYSGKCQSMEEVLCSVCKQGFCWDHILTLCFALEDAVVNERYVCRNCTEHLFDKIEEERLRLKRDFQILEQDIAALKGQLDEESETSHE
jgi:hypothetical protein